MRMREKDYMITSMKRVAGIVLFLAMLFGMNRTGLAASFPDVPSSEWYYDTVMWASENGLITGYDDGRFGPGDDLQRGQFATILYRMEGEPAQTFEPGIYSDVEDGKFYSDAVVWAKHEGVITGYDDGRFGPTDIVTREQVATILYRYAQKQGKDTSAAGEIEAYPDGGSVAGFAYDGVRFALGAGMIRHDGGYINPGGNASRAQIATILQRYFAYVDREEAANISNVDSEYTIEADVKLTGAGTGYHAKLVAAAHSDAGDSAVSFGIQYDQWGEHPYTDRTTFLIENVASNNPGGQKYVRTGYASRDQVYHLMLAVQKNGHCDVYVNGVCVGSVENEGIANQAIGLRVEGSGRKNGDAVHAEFSNIRLKARGVYESSKAWGTHNFDSNTGVHSYIDGFADNQTIVVDGTIEGLSDEQDWDNAFGIVSGIIQFVG